MRFAWRVTLRKRLTPRNVILLTVLVLGLTSCAHTRHTRTKTPDPGIASLNPGWPKANKKWVEKENPILRVSFPQVADAEFVDDDELCMTCHSTYAKSFAHNVHRGQKCEDCHGPASRHLQTRGKEPGLILNFKTLPAAQRSEICLKCHENYACSQGSEWRTSVHAHKGLGCTDCHRSHYNVRPGTPATNQPGEETADLSSVLTLTALQEETVEPGKKLPSLRGTSHHLAAVAPEVCYKCHQDKYQLQAIAHPHQIGGPNGFNCTTCHDPHGKILESSRQDLCLNCHTGSPTSAWHSSTHFRAGVACTDCHNPHPETTLHRIADINHTHINRPPRTPMSVDDPNVCFKCHPKMLGLTSMPSHHPIKEGKMVCADCHDPHGQFEGNLKEATVNMVCYKCHADKQGPFVYEHPPVTEDCAICHNPHGTVENNLLKQPTTFLCLRCHSGHRVAPNFGPHIGAGLVDVGTSPLSQRAFYSDCTQCHAQIHGTNLPSPHNPQVFMR